MIDGLKRLLAHSSVFDFYQRLIGAEESKRKFVDQMIRPEGPGRVLDIGCGTGSVVSFLPDGLEVIGIDFSEKYIASAIRRFGSRARFVLGDLTDPALDLGGSFDLAYAYGVFHHLPDEPLVGLVRSVMNHLRPGGLIVAADPALVDGQGAISRLIVRNDRGQHVRSPDQLSRLLAEFDPKIEVRHDQLRIPFAMAMTTLRKAK